MDELEQRLTMTELLEWAEVFKLEREALDKAARDAKRR